MNNKNWTSFRTLQLSSKKKKEGQMQWHTPASTTTQEAEIGGSWLELAWDPVSKQIKT
jgi:hypothetical protein